MIIFLCNATATSEIYTLSYTTLFRSWQERTYVEKIRFLQAKMNFVQTDGLRSAIRFLCNQTPNPLSNQDRKSTRLNSSHTVISYAVFCLKKKKKTKKSNVKKKYTGNI